MTPDFSFERQVRANFNVKIVAGVDEVGRGALAGPLVAAAVVFDDSIEINGALYAIRDSKILEPKMRQKLAEVIKKRALDFAFGLVEVLEIDKYGIGAANVMAFDRALQGLKNCDFALIDGRPFRGFGHRYLCLEKGESKSISIAAASIIAKVYRDALMDELHSKYRVYRWGSNKGYGSFRHLKVLKTKGPTPYHRQSFLKDLASLNQTNTLF